MVAEVVVGNVQPGESGKVLGERIEEMRQA
jgi:hypothetical protein